MSVVSVSVPEMVRPRVVGPNLPSGLRRPDRSVSLPDPRRAAAMGGAIWFYGGYGNPPQKQIGPNSWGAAESEYQKLADAVQKTAAEVGEVVDADNPDEVLDWLGDEPIWVEVTPEGTVVEVPEPDPADWVPGEVPDPDVVPDAPPATGSPLLAQGLTADEAVSSVGPQMLPNVPVPNFQGPQVHAMAGNGPPNWQEDLPLGDRPGRRLTPAQIAAGKAGVETAKGILEGTVEPPPEPVETPEPPPPVQDELFPDPEARSLDAAMLQELFLQRAS